MKNYVIIILLIFTLVGCISTKPAVRTAQDTSLEKYKKLEVMLVLNETGKTFDYDFDVAATLTQHIKTQLKDKGYVINEEKEVQDDILIIKNSLIYYDPGTLLERWIQAGSVVVKTTLVDKKSGKNIGEILTTGQVGGGLYSVGGEKKILKGIAKEIANEIEITVKVE